MYTGKLVFSQVMEHLPLHVFHQCVDRYDGNFKVKEFTCLDQYLCMAFAQLTYRESLRDIEACLRAQKGKPYHMGIRSAVSRNTLANANKVRDWRIYADLASSLIQTARKLYLGDGFAVELDSTVYALDGTTIDLCLSIPLGQLQKEQGSVQASHAAGSARQHPDFERLYPFTHAGCFFVIRAKSNLRCRRVYSQPVDRTTGVICDQSVQLTGFYSAKHYPEMLRRVKYYDAATDKTLVYLTNNFALPAQTIAELYRCRWQVELFFKWIKQNLRIKTFYGTSENAVKAQIWIAVSVYVLVAIMKKRLKIEASLYTILQVLSVTIFERITLLQALTDVDYNNNPEQKPNQLILFN